MITRDRLLWSCDCMRHIDTSTGTVTLVLPDDAHALDSRPAIDRVEEVLPIEVGASAKSPVVRWMHSWTLLAPILNQIGKIRQGERRGWELAPERARLAALLREIQDAPESGWPYVAPDASADPYEGLRCAVGDILTALSATLQELPSVETNTWAAVDSWLRWTSEGREHNSSAQATKRLMWAKGLTAPTEVTLTALVGLRSLTLSLVETQRTRAVAPRTVAAPTDLPARLLPASLLANLGPLTPTQQSALPHFRDLVDLRRSMIVAAPPGVGKTRLGQMAATYATCDPETGARRESGAKVLVLMPTRALIDEQLEAWKDWLRVPGADPLLRVVGVSAEHDVHRRDVTAGDFDVAVCVYESAANLLAGPQRVRLLSEIALIVVDEWQWMRDDQRGGRLDALLTGLQVNEQDPPPVMLMGPELDRRSHDAAVQWLSSSRSIMTTKRITELTVHVTSASKEVVRTETPEGKPEAPKTVDLDQPLSEAFGKLSADMKQRLGTLPSRGLPVVLAAKLLAEDDSRRVIVFVEARDVAVRCAESAIRLLNHARIGVDPTGRNPWESGRFTSANRDDRETDERNRETDERNPEAEHRKLLASAPIAEVYDTARWWLMNGVAVHTASIEGEMQKLFIRELDTGIVRLMFATDTVAEGINVAASHVIVGSTFRGAAGQEELVQVHRVRQRLNRAGRRGRWEDHGHAYLCVAPKAPGAIIDTQVATNPNRAFAHFIDTDRGLAVAPGGNARGDRIDRLAAIALHHLRHRDVIRTRARMLTDIKGFLERTYLAAYTAKPIADDDAMEVIDRLKAQLAVEDIKPDAQLPAVVLALLEREGAVAADVDGSDKLRVTPLGHVIDENAFPLSSARTVRGLRAMLDRSDPPSDLDLLCQAAADATTRSRIAWAFTRNRDLEINLVENLQTVLGRYAACAPGIDVEELQLELACGGGIGRPRIVPHEDLFLAREGRELIAGGPLAALLESDADLIADADPGAERRPDLGGHLLLRTLLAYEWANFEARSHTTTRVNEHVFGPAGDRHDARVRWRVDGPDLRNFVRSCGHLLGAAHALFPRHARLAEGLAGRLRRGLPARLASLDAANFAFAGREHLVAFAHGRLSMTEIVDQLDLDKETRLAADDWLVARAARLRARRSNLDRSYAAEPLIPQSAGTHGLTAEGLLHSLALNELDDLKMTLEPFHVALEGSVLSLPASNPDTPLRIIVADAAYVASRPAAELLGDAPSLIVALGELPDSLIHADERLVITPAELIRALIRTGAEYSLEAAASEFGTQLYRYFDRR